MSPSGDNGRMMRFQAQAVLRRPDQQAPLRLVGVLVAGSFYPATAQDAWGPLHLEGGLVALAPLDPIDTEGPEQAAALALRQASRDWADGHSPDGIGPLRWRPMGEVRVPADGRTVAELIEKMTVANETRLGATPSTPPYHGAAREHSLSPASRIPWIGDHDQPGRRLRRPTSRRRPS